MVWTSVLVAGLVLAESSPAAGGQAAPDPATGASFVRLRLTAAPFADPPPRHFPGSLPELRYFGGPVLSHLQLVPVFWSTPNAELRARLDGFYSDFVAGPMFSWLDEYATTVPSVDGGPGTGQHIGPGTFAGSVVIIPSRTPVTLTTSDLVAELREQIDGGFIPAPGPDTMYVIHLGTGVRLAGDCVDYCAFHGAFAYQGTPVAAALIPDFGDPRCARGCGRAQTVLDNLTTVISHEVIEGVTDPLPCSGWCDPDIPNQGDLIAGEIADLCSFQFFSSDQELLSTDGGSTYMVQREWSNAARACIVTADTAFSVTLAPSDAGPAAFTVHTTMPASGSPDVALSLGGFAGRFDPPGVSAGGSATLYLTLDETTPYDVSFEVAAMGGPTVALAAGELLVPDFSLGLDNPLVGLDAGASTRFTLSSAQLDGGPQLLTLAVDPQPGFAVDMDRTSMAAGEATSGTLTVDPLASSGPVTIPLRADNGVRQRHVGLTVDVDGNDFSIALVGETTVTLAAESSVTLHVTTGVTHGTPVPLTLSAAPLNELVATFDPPTVQAGAGSTLVLRAGASLPDYQLVKLSASGVNATSTAWLTVLGVPAQSSGCGTVPGRTSWVALLAALLWLRRRRRARAERLRRRRWNPGRWPPGAGYRRGARSSGQGASS